MSPTNFFTPQGVYFVRENSNESGSSQSSSSSPKKRGPRPKILTAEERRQKRADANDRERQRMGQLNTAFNQVRKPARYFVSVVSCLIPRSRWSRLAVHAVFFIRDIGECYLGCLLKFLKILLVLSTACLLFLTNNDAD